MECPKKFKQTLLHFSSILTPNLTETRIIFLIPFKTLKYADR